MKQLLKILGVLIILGLIGVLFYQEQKYNKLPENTNFNSTSEEMQFYKNMRYASNNISYSISPECTLQKKSEMERAFEIISNLTGLNFYYSNNPEIEISCQSTLKYEGEMFIAGEGGPSKITSLENFNLISKGNILLIKKSDCQNPNVAIHELIHTLGFTHSNNPGNIMYNISNCNQGIGEDLIQRIKEIYSSLSLPDIKVTQKEFKYKDGYGNVSISIFNEGLKKSEATTLEISSENKIVKSSKIDSLEPGYGNTISITNLYLGNSKDLSVYVDSSFNELTKENNKIKLIV